MILQVSNAGEQCSRMHWASKLSTSCIFLPTAARSVYSSHQMPLMFEAMPPNTCLGLPLGAIREDGFLESQRREEAEGLTVRKVTVPARSSRVKVVRRSLRWKYVPTCGQWWTQHRSTMCEPHEPYRGPTLGPCSDRRCNTIDGRNADAQGCRLPVQEHHE